jgi:choline dehydrogenase-like flavoprotein
LETWAAPVSSTVCDHHRELSRLAGVHSLSILHSVRLRSECQVEHRGHGTADRFENGNCTLKTKCVVDHVLTGARGRATGVSYLDEQDRPQVQEADLVVLSANAAEGARILLNSGNRQSHWAPGPSIAINDFVVGRLGGGHIYNFYVHHPVGFASRRPPGAARWGRAHKDFQRKYFNRFMQMNSDISDLPVETNRVEIDPEIRDAWGIPRTARHPQVRAVEVWNQPTGGGLGVGQHQCGTCRMGNDPKTSVLNPHCQTHDVDNLFVIDTSCFVSFPGHNPSLTAQAIAYRSCEYIKTEWRGGAFRTKV